MTKTKIREILFKNMTLLMFFGAFCNSLIPDRSFSSFIGMCILISIIKGLHYLAYSVIGFLLEEAVKKYSELED